MSVNVCESIVNVIQSIVNGYLESLQSGHPFEEIWSAGNQTATTTILRIKLLAV